jgi:hypothetical protein
MLRMDVSRRLLSLIAAVIFLAALPVTLGAETNIRLYLKDGSFQLVNQYDVQGDRVRYYSVERSEWEEIPLSLVDFARTKKAQEEEKQHNAQELRQAKELENERFAPLTHGYEVAPGIYLPGDQGVFVFDGKRVLRMIQSSGEVVNDRRRATLILALPVPMVHAQAFVILDGPKAAVRVDTDQPVFFVQTSGDLGSRLELVTLKVGKDARLVEKIEAHRTEPSELRATMSMVRTQVKPGVYKLAPSAALSPGEYALGELLQKKLNLELWDFGVDRLGQ